MKVFILKFNLNRKEHKIVLNLKFKIQKRNQNKIQTALNNMCLSIRNFCNPCRGQY